MDLPSVPTTASLAEIIRYLELQQVQLTELPRPTIQHMIFEDTHVEPSPVRDNLTVRADGTDWDPGFGAGLYRYNEADTTWIHLEGAGGAGGSQFLWETITSDSGSAVANTTTDTLSILGGTGISTAVVGDVLTITNSSPNVTQLLWETITSDSGFTVANIATDNLSILGGSGISTAIVGDVLTIVNDSPNVTQNLFLNVASDSGTAVADNATDTLTIVGGTGISTAVVGDTLTITNDSPNIVYPDQNLFLNVLSDSGTAVADNTADTLTIAGGIGISTAVVGDVLTITNDFTAQNIWETITSDSGSAVANTTTDTLTIAGGTNITTSIVGDVLTIDQAGSDPWLVVNSVLAYPTATGTDGVSMGPANTSNGVEATIVGVNNANSSTRAQIFGLDNTAQAGLNTPLIFGRGNTIAHHDAYIFGGAITSTKDDTMYFGGPEGPGVDQGLMTFDIGSGVGDTAAHGQGRLSIFGVNAAFLLPSYDIVTKSRPDPPVNGLMIYNSQSEQAEVYANGGWTNMGSFAEYLQTNYAADSFPVATGSESLALGYGCTTAALNGVAMGRLATTSATGANQLSIGDASTTDGGGAVAVGADADALSAGSVAIGQSSRAGTVSGSNSVAIGTNAEATIDSAVALGQGSKATGGGLMAVGHQALATTTAAIAIGSGCSASANSAIAIGSVANSVANETHIGRNALKFRIKSTGVLSVEDAPNYETLVIADDHIPNKKYVDDAIDDGLIP